MVAIVEADPATSAAFDELSEANLRLFLREPFTAIGSDASNRNTTGPLSSDRPHPRAFGTFARFLGRICRDQGSLPLEQGIRRLTSLPAELLGIADRRGSLLPGYPADVVLFDPAAVLDLATYEQPLQYAAGVRHVLVNGQLVVEDGAHTGAKAGRFVRGPGFKS